MSSPLLARLDARDRALFLRLTLNAGRTHWMHGMWTGITHLGGARASISLCLLSALLPPVRLTTAALALVLLGATHVVVQLVKRLAVRDRPSLRTVSTALIRAPDRFSFPSGHACAAMTLATVFAWTFPSLALPIVTLAMLVGLSRVLLGVHYPGDVAAGQAIAVLVSVAVMASL